MSESIHISATTKQEKYEMLILQIKALIQGEKDLIANLANSIAALKQEMNFFWVGIYFVKGRELVVGPFQGPVACTRIRFGKGVCGTSWEGKKTIIVDDVDKFPGHIACNSNSRSEIVIPCFKNTNEREVFAVLDVDSDKLNDFDLTDKKYLEQITELFSQLDN